MYLLFAAIFVFLTASLIFLFFGSFSGRTPKRSDDARRVLLIVSALVEVFAGLSLAVLPSTSFRLLLGVLLVDPAASVIARVAGAAFTSLGLACWMARNDGQSRAGRGVVWTMLLYNVSAAAALAYGHLAFGLFGVLLWPAVLLHVSMGTGCLGCLFVPKKLE